MPWYIHVGVFIVAVLIAIPIMFLFNLPVGAKYIIVWPLYYIGIKIVRNKRTEKEKASDHSEKVI